MPFRGRPFLTEIGSVVPWTSSWMRWLGLSWRRGYNVRNSHECRPRSKTKRVIPSHGSRLAADALPSVRRGYALITMFSSTRRRALLRPLAAKRRALSSSSTAPKLPIAQHGHLPNSQSLITSKLHFFSSVMGEGKQIPSYRVLDHYGKAVEGAEVPDVRSW